MRFCLPLFALLLVAACGKSDSVRQGADGALLLGGVEQTEVVERGVVPGRRSLVLTGFSGDITLSGTQSDQAALRFTKKGRGDSEDDAREALDDITIEEAGDDTAYRYTFRSRNPARTAVDVEGTVPAGTRLEITLDNANVVVRAFSAPVVIRVQNGRVQVASASSDVDVETQNGDMTVALARVPETARVRLATQNGRIALGLPVDAGARIEASTEVGRIRSEGLDFRSQNLEPKGAGATFRAAMGSGAARVEIETQNGSIELSDAERLTVISAVPPAAADTTAR